jgi:hypothetical protein
VGFTPFWPIGVRAVHYQIYTVAIFNSATYDCAIFFNSRTDLELGASYLFNADTPRFDIRNADGSTVGCRLVPWAMHTVGLISHKKGQIPRFWCWIDSVCPCRGPEASATPSGTLGATLHTYHVGLKQQPPRRLCPGQCTQKGNG